MRRSAENIEEKKETDIEKFEKLRERKTREYKEIQIAIIYIFGFKLYFAWKHSLKKSSLYLYTITFYLQFLCVAGYLKHSNDTPKLNIHKYANNIIEIYINRLITTTQIFIALDYSILMLEKYFHFTKRKKHFGKDILFPHRRSNWIHVLWKYFSNYVFLRFLEDKYKNLKEIGIIQGVSKLTIFANQWISKLHSSLYY